MSCIQDINNPNIFTCSDPANTNSSTTYIKDVSTNYGSNVYVPAYRDIPDNCITNLNGNAVCLEYTKPEVLNKYNTLKPYYISTLTKSGEFYVQDMPKDPDNYKKIVYNYSSNASMKCLISDVKDTSDDTKYISKCIGNGYDNKSNIEETH